MKKINLFLKRFTHKALIPVFWFILGIAVAVCSIIYWYYSNNVTINQHVVYEPLQALYYIFSIVGAIGTVFAVVVALTKESIMKWLYKPRLHAELVDDGITEILKDDIQGVLKASSFQCYVKIENFGSFAALGCRAQISDVSYASNKRLNSLPNVSKRVLLWDAGYVDIPVNMKTKLLLFEIKNPNSIGTPKDSSKQPQKPVIQFNGCSLDISKRQKGKWQIDYFISSKNGNIYSFRIEIEWGGVFKNRATEMRDVLSVKLEEK